jgi:hypothetical protein
VGSVPAVAVSTNDNNAGNDVARATQTRHNPKSKHEAMKKRDT